MDEQILELDGASLAVKYTEYGDRLVGRLRLPSGKTCGYEIHRDIDFVPAGTLWSHGDRDLSDPADRAVADRLFPLTPDPDQHGPHRRPSRALRVAAWALAEPDWSPRRIALEAAARVTAGTRKEDFLPFVTAALQHFTAAQSTALEHDEAAASFAIAGEQLQYRADFHRLTGRDFDPAADVVTRAEIEALPVTPPAPVTPVVYECLECGATFDQPGMVEPGGMACRRCSP